VTRSLLKGAEIEVHDVEREIDAGAQAAMGGLLWLLDRRVECPMRTPMAERRYVALLRGINVGRAKRIAMADLRALVASLGYGDVRTLLNSGNVVFTAPEAAAGNAAARIEAALPDRIGVSARVTVLSASEIAAIVADNPLLAVASDPSRLLVGVLNDKSDRPRLEALLKEDWTPDALALGERVAYIWCPQGILANRLAETIGRALRDGVTSRNWATMLKLHALTQDPP
jgi:uncharacterized protein (DUF1697 family)